MLYHGRIVCKIDQLPLSDRNRILRKEKLNCYLFLAKNRISLMLRNHVYKMLN